MPRLCKHFPMTLCFQIRGYNFTRNYPLIINARRHWLQSYPLSKNKAAYQIGAAKWSTLRRLMGRNLSLHWSGAQRHFLAYPLTGLISMVLPTEIDNCIFGLLDDRLTVPLRLANSIICLLVGCRNASLPYRT